MSFWDGRGLAQRRGARIGSVPRPLRASADPAAFADAWRDAMRQRWKRSVPNVVHSSGWMCCIGKNLEAMLPEFEIDPPRFRLPNSMR
jgi:hypothetical protein